MRERLAAGLLRQIGLTETIATSIEDYVDMASALGQRSKNKNGYLKYKNSIKKRAPMADNNLAAVRAFESFIQSKIKQN